MSCAFCNGIRKFISSQILIPKWKPTPIKKQIVPSSKLLKQIQEKPQ